MENKTAN